MPGIDDIFARFGIAKPEPASELHAPAAPPGAFPLSGNRFLTKRERKVVADRAEKVSKKFIHPANVKGVVDHLPADGERTHCVVRGDFVLCDLVPAIIAARGTCNHLRAVSLGINPANVTTFCGLLDAGKIGRLDLVLSHYFERVDSNTKWAKAKTELLESGRPCRMRTSRSHAKVILLPTASGDWFSIEGSANLRASGNVEQFAVFNDRETFDFHAAWIDTLLGG